MDRIEVKDVEQYEIDIDKIKTYYDLLLFIRAIIPGEHVYINSLSPYYEDLRHLAKDKES